MMIKIQSLKVIVRTYDLIILLGSRFQSTKQRFFSHILILDNFFRTPYLFQIFKDEIYFAFVDIFFIYF